MFSPTLREWIKEDSDWFQIVINATKATEIYRVEMKVKKATMKVHHFSMKITHLLTENNTSTTIS